MKMDKIASADCPGDFYGTEKKSGTCTGVSLDKIDSTTYQDANSAE
jgi:hypothetical protein